jgi:hypothetical protein
MLAVAESFGKIALEFPAVIGLPDQIAEGDAVAIQMLLDAGGEDGVSRGAASIGEGPEERSTANIAGGVQDRGQSEPLGLQPVAQEVVEILGIGADLPELGPLRFDVRQVLFALVFPASFLEQAVLVPNALQSGVGDGKVELADQAASAEGGKSFSQFVQLRLDGRRSVKGLVMASARPSEQARRAALLETAQPFADGGHGVGEELRGGFVPAFAGAFDQSQAMAVGVVFYLRHQIEIASSSHGGRILTAAKRRGKRLWKSRCVKNQSQVFHPAWKSRHPSGIPTFSQPRRRRSFPTPADYQQFHLCSPSLARTLQPRQGDKMCVGSSRCPGFLTNI